MRVCAHKRRVKASGARASISARKTSTRASQTKGACFALSLVYIGRARVWRVSIGTDTKSSVRGQFPEESTVLRARCLCQKHPYIKSLGTDVHDLGGTSSSRPSTDVSANASTEVIFYIHILLGYASLILRTIFSLNCDVMNLLISGVSDASTYHCLWETCSVPGTDHILHSGSSAHSIFSSHFSHHA